MICGYCRRYRGKAHLVLLHVPTCAVETWRPVVEARAAGNHSRAERLRKELLGVKVEMPEERKEYLKKYNEEHKEELRERARFRRRLRREMMKPQNTRRRSK